VIPVSPGWLVAAERIQEREMVGGEQWRAGNGPPGGKAHRSQQSLGRRSRSAGGGSGETCRGGSLPITPPQKERHLEEAPSHSPHPRRCPWAGCGVESAPLTKNVSFRLISGTHFLFHLSDSIMPPL